MKFCNATFKRPLDVAFLIDGSNSLKKEEFEIMKSFVIKLTGNGSTFFGLKIVLG